MNSLKNILAQAMTVIPNSKYEYRKFISNTVNDIGNPIHSYGDWISTIGVVEPGKSSAFGSRNIGETNEQKVGIDYSNSIISVWAKNVNLNTTSNGQGAPDQIRFSGRIYNVKSVSDWFGYNGWKMYVCEQDVRETT